MKMTRWLFPHKIAVRKRDATFVRIDAGNLAFDKTDSPIEQRLAQIERDIFSLVMPESESNQRRLKEEVTATRGESYLVATSELFRRRLSGDNATKAAAYNQYSRH